MSKLLIVVFLVFGQLSAQDFHSRILIRGAKQIESSNFGVVGWLIAPNITSATDKWLHIAGPMYKFEHWHVEVMGGAVVQSGESTKLIDIRSGFSEALFGNIGISMWSNTQWIDPLSSSDKIYLYYQIGYSLVDKVLSPFIETENIFHLVENQVNDLSAGVGLVVHISQRMNMILVHQWHNTGKNQVWFRTVINL